MLGTQILEVQKSTIDAQHSKGLLCHRRKVSSCAVRPEMRGALTTDCLLDTSTVSMASYTHIASCGILRQLYIYHRYYIELLTLSAHAQ